MKHISFFLKDIDRQIEDYVRHKKRRSIPSAVTHQEHLRVFKRIVGRANVYDIEESDLCEYRKWVFEKFPTNYMASSALQSVRGFLTFFRCDLSKRKIVKF